MMSVCHLAPNLLGCILEWLKPSNKNMSENQQTIRPLIVFIKASEDARGDELAKCCPTEVHILAVVEMSLFLEKLDSVHQETVDYNHISTTTHSSSSRTVLTNRNIILLIKLINQRPHNRDIDAHVSQLVQTEVVLHNRDDVATDAVDVGVDGQMGVGGRVAAKDLVVELMAKGGPVKKGPTFGRFFDAE